MNNSKVFKTRGVLGDLSAFAFSLCSLCLCGKDRIANKKSPAELLQRATE